MLPNVKCVASSIPEIMNEFKICRQTDTGHISRNGADTVHLSRDQNITCHAHFVWRGRYKSHDTRMSGYEREKRKVLKRCLKTASDCADVTWSRRSFHMLAPATGNARLPL